MCPPDRVSLTRGMFLLRSNIPEGGPEVSTKHTGFLHVVNYMAFMYCQLAH